MKKLLILFFFFPLFTLAQTCDVDLIGFDPETNQISVAILNGENCGCNDFTSVDGNTCSDSPSSTTGNNESITHFVFGLHIYEDFTEGPCSQADFHPGWAYAYPPNQTQLPFTGGHVTGDTVNVELITFNDWDCLLEQNFDEECLELVVWQINLSQTADIVDFPNQFWTDTCGTCADQTQMYPDIDLSNNTLVWCPDELPPSPLYPGCTDEEADNYDPEATFDDSSCFYTVVGCTDPIACNYNNSANTPDNENCIYCDTPNGEELCNAYHGEGSDYWEFYSNIFDCDPSIIDLEIDSVYFVAANCNIFNSTPPLCDEGLRFNISYTNKGTVPVDSWYFTTTLNGWEYTTTEFGINFPQPPYNQPVLPGQSPGDVNIVTGQPVWQEGDTLFATVNLIGVEDDNLSNNNDYFILPAYPICVQGCMDPLAENYDPIATCEEECLYAVLGCTDPEANNYNPLATEDDGSCEYDITELFYIDYECDLHCDTTGAWYNSIVFFENIGNTTITDFCIEWDIIGFNEVFIECFEGELLPGEDIIIEFGPITSDGGGGVVIRLESLNGEETDITWFQPTSCYQNALATCIYGCTDETANNYLEAADIDDGSCEYDITELTYVDAECFVDCDLSGPFYYVNTTWTNTGNIEITDFCAEWDVIGGDGDDVECFNGNLMPGDTTGLLFGPYTSEQGLLAWAYLQVLNGVTFDPPIENYETLYCWAGAEASCIYGCTDPEATNYNPLATVDDGSCEFVIYLGGCTDPEAANYNPMATYDDGSCIYLPEPCDGSYYIPNTFTPNNDGVNDGWAAMVADPDCWRSWYVAVYNRWGGLVWESSTVGEVWPASVFGGNHYVADGVYVYLVRGEGWNPDHTFKATGHITIFR